MGMNNENAARMVFDIETAPLSDAANYIEAAEAPANYKDPAKIAAAIAEKNAENLSRCGLDVDLCRIVAIGVMSEHMEGPLVLMTPDDEAGMLRVFWQNVGDRHLVGFNCLGFDLPVLFRRSLYLGVPTPSIGIDKFKHPQVTDLMRVLDFNGALKSRGLAFYCKRFGIDVTDTMTGVDIATAVSEERWADVEHHVKADIEKTAVLANRLGCFHHQAALVSL